MDSPLMPEPKDEPIGILLCSETSLWMVVLTIFMDNAADSLLTPILPSYAKSAFQASHQEIFNLSAFPCAAALICAPLGSWAANKFGRKPVLVLSMVGIAAGALWQGFASSYEILLAGRTFVGCFLVVMTTAKMYLTEVAPGKHNVHARVEWNSRLAAAQAAAQAFGPGIGGGLSTYGINIPSIACCVVEVCGACVSAAFLDESPVYLDMKRSKRISDDKSKETSSGLTRKSKPWAQILFFWLASACASGMAKVAPFAFNIYVQKKYQMTAKDIGFAYSFVAILTLVCTRFLKPLGKSFGTRNAAMLTSLMAVVCMVLMPVYPGTSAEDSGVTRLRKIVPIVLTLAVANSAATAIDSFTTSLSADLSAGDPAMNGFMQSGALQFRMASKTLGSLVAGMMSETNSFLLCAGMMFVALPCCYLIVPWARTVTLNREVTLYGVDWVDEKGTAQDVRELGEFMADLLTRKHIKWVSRKEQVRTMLERVTPMLPTSTAEEYEAAFRVISD